MSEYIKGRNFYFLSRQWNVSTCVSRCICSCSLLTFYSLLQYTYSYRKELSRSFVRKRHCTRTKELEWCASGVRVQESRSILDCKKLSLRISMYGQYVELFHGGLYGKTRSITNRETEGVVELKLLCLISSGCASCDITRSHA